MKQLQHIHRLLSRLPWSALMLLTFAMLIALGYLDFLTGYQISLSVFYFVPVYLSTWYGGRFLGILNSILAATVWMVAAMHSGMPFPSPWVASWDFLDRFAIFAVVTLLLGSVHNRLRVEARQANTDLLTGLVNRRRFYMRVDEESARLRRYKRPFTLVYIDMDNFKDLNDVRGHSEGDEALRVFGEHIRLSTRQSDVVGRVGGDEFAALFPETDAVRAKSIMVKLLASLNALMHGHDWPITFSAGAITFLEPMDTAEAMVHAADALMYEVKRGTKDGFRHEVWPKTDGE